jgi:ribosomal protein L30
MVARWFFFVPTRPRTWVIFSCAIGSRPLTRADPQHARRSDVLQRQTLRSLGLKRINDSVVQEDRPEIRGMVATVPHLVHVEEV